MRFRVKATLGNSHGIYEAAYDFGEESELRGEPQEIGLALANYLQALTPATSRSCARRPAVLSGTHHHPGRPARGDHLHRGLAGTGPEDAGPQDQGADE